MKPIEYFHTNQNVYWYGYFHVPSSPIVQLFVCPKGIYPHKMLRKWNAWIRHWEIFNIGNDLHKPNCVYCVYVELLLQRRRWVRDKLLLYLIHSCDNRKLSLHCNCFKWNIYMSHSKCAEDEWLTIAQPLYRYITKHRHFCCCCCWLTLPSPFSFSPANPFDKNGCYNRIYWYQKLIPSLD